MEKRGCARDSKVSIGIGERQKVCGYVLRPGVEGTTGAWGNGGAFLGRRNSRGGQ